MAYLVLTLDDGSEQRVDLVEDLITVGRLPDSHLVLSNPSVSSQHATITRQGEQFYLQDLGATNGTKVNGVEIEDVRLEHGDQVTFGDVLAIFYAQEASVAVVDEPLVPMAVSEPIKLPDRYSPVPTHRQYAQGRVGPAPVVIAYKEPSPAKGFAFFVLFLILSFSVGAHLSHYKNHESVLLLDVLKHYQGDLVEATDSSSAK